MTALPEPSKSTAKEIYKLWSSRNEPSRPHMGCSIIGHACDRFIWYSWRWAMAPEFEGRILRLFNTGHREEERLTQDLRDIGVELHTIDEETGKQVSVSALDGHLAGSLDGIGKGFPEAPKTWAVLECKTHGSKSFAKLQKEGVRGAKPQHFVQMQMYMGLMELDRAMYLAQNKDTDEIYPEWVHFDEAVFKQHMARAEKLIGATEPPEKLSNDPAWYECKFCDFYELCHGQRAADMNCRTCCHASPVEEAGWHCGLMNIKLKEKDQRKGCEGHLYIPPLIPYAKPIDGSSNSVVYQKPDGTTFTNGPGHWLSSELAVTVHTMVGDKGIDEIKEAFPGARVVSSEFKGFSDLEGDFDEELKKDLPDPKKEKTTAQNKAFAKGMRKQQ